VVDLTAAFFAMHENRGGGSYKESLSSIFAGNQDKAEILISKFNRYWKLNSLKEEMVQPYLHIILALSYCKGERVQDWVNA
jgi:hypothetical protein